MTETPLDPRHILIRGVNWLGDAVMTTPALQRLRERFPKARITLLAPEKLEDLWRLHPAINDVLTFGAEESVFTVARRLRAEKGDLGLILPNSPRSALEMWLAKVPIRVGFAQSWRSRFLSLAVPRGPEHVRMRKRSKAGVMELIRFNVARQTWPASAHQIHEYLRLVSVLGANPQAVAPTIAVSRAEIQAAAEKFGLTGSMPGARPLFGINPGAEYGPAKRWPADRFTDAALKVSGRIDCAWLILGGPSDAQVASRIAAGIGKSGAAVVNLAGKTSLRELCGLLRLCRALLTNDTGPMHLAAAVGTPVVVPFGSTAPELTGPGLPGDPHHRLLAGDVPCAPCFRRECPIDLRCLKRITPEQVERELTAVASA